MSQIDKQVEASRGESTQLNHLVAISTTIGRTHSVNQDAVGAHRWRRSDGTHASLVLVADGVSAGLHSEIASRMVVDTLLSDLAPLMEDSQYHIGDLREALLASARRANHLVAQRPHAATTTADSTTLVAAVCLGDRAVGLWCGDSRVYLVRGGEVAPLTRDHSWAEGVVGQGLMSAEQAANDPRAHMITRWLGPPDQDDPGFETFRLKLEPGDTILCCSDGLYLYFSTLPYRETEIGELLSRADEPLQTAVDRLASIAVDRGGHDDISIAAMRLAPGH